jgi:hypothetical protein
VGLQGINIKIFMTDRRPTRPPYIFIMTALETHKGPPYIFIMTALETHKGPPYITFIDNEDFLCFLK